MRMTVISHFFNEEYLLPWWLSHHREIFSDGILIDYGSSDDSLNIVREFTPNWRVIRTANRDFDPFAVDLEVMRIERQVSGWKIALNTTEFLILGSNWLSGQASDWKHGLRIPGVTMVDRDSQRAPLMTESLLEQKPWGIDTWKWNVVQMFRANFQVPDGALNYFQPNYRGRLIHRFADGRYNPGRHSWSVSSRNVPHGSFILWYNLSPWNERTRARKAQVRSKIPSRLARSDPDGMENRFPSEETLAAIHRSLCDFAAQPFDSMRGLDSDVQQLLEAAEFVRLRDLHDQAQSFTSSVSWRLTRPLRSTRGMFRN